MTDTTPPTLTAAELADIRAAIADRAALALQISAYALGLARRRGITLTEPQCEALTTEIVAAATGKLPADLGAWVLELVMAAAPACDRRELRDRLLVEAARELLPDGSTWARAEALAVEMTRVRAHELVAAALEVDPAAPRSPRQLFRILTSTAFRFQTEATDGR